MKTSPILLVCAVAVLSFSSRTQGATPPQAPGGISVPASSSTGNFTITWQASSGAQAYDLEEDATSTFTNPTMVYSGASTSFSASNRQSGIYYYRARATNQNGTSSWVAGSTCCTVVIMNAPNPLSVNRLGSGLHLLITWGVSNGAAFYRLEEDILPTFPNPMLAYSGAAVDAMGRVNIFFIVNNPSANAGTYYYRIRAENGPVFTPWTIGNNPCIVGPSSVSVPSTSSTGSYVVLWTQVPGATAYEVQEDMSPSFNVGWVWTYSYDVAGIAPSGKANGTYYYRVRAVCNSHRGDWIAGSNGCTVYVPPPPQPASISVPLDSSRTRHFLVSWDAVSTASAYDLDEDTSASFPNPSTVYSGPSTSAYVTEKTNGAYFYRVRATNPWGTSQWTAGNNGCLVDIRGTLSFSLGSAISGPPTKAPGERRVTVLQFSICSNDAEDITVGRMRVRAFGTLEDTLCIEGACLYLDVNNNGRVDDGVDSLLAGPVLFDSDDGLATFEGFTRTIVRNRRELWLLSYDLSPGAGTGDTFGASIGADCAVVADGSVTGFGGPDVTGTPVQGAEKTVGLVGSLGASLDPANSETSTAVPESRVTALGLLLSAGSGEPVIVRHLTLTVSGTMADPQDHLLVSLYSDSDGDGRYGASDMSVSIGVPIDPETKTAFFKDIDVVVAAGSQALWFVVVDVLRGAPGGMTFAFALEKNEDIVVRGMTYSMACQVSGAPLAGSAATVTEEESPCSSDGGPGCCGGAPGAKGGRTGLALLCLAFVLAKRRCRGEHNSR